MLKFFKSYFRNVNELMFSYNEPDFIEKKKKKTDKTKNKNKNKNLHLESGTSNFSTIVIDAK